MEKKRIAFCFSGQARTLEYTYNYIKTYLLDQAQGQGYDYDVFCAIEDDNDADKVALLNPTQIIKIKSNEVENLIKDKFLDTDKKNVYNNIGFIGITEKTIIAILQQSYKIQKAFEIKNLYCQEKGISYDVVVRLRFDCAFLQKINFHNIINDTAGNNMILCNKRRGILGDRIREMHDFFFWGNENAMTPLATCFDDFFITLQKNHINPLFTPLLKILRTWNKRETKNKIENYVFYLYCSFLSLFIKIYVAERYFYECFFNKHISLKKTTFNFLLVRKNFGQSLIWLYDVGTYEL